MQHLGDLPVLGQFILILKCFKVTRLNSFDQYNYVVCHLRDVRLSVPSILTHCRVPEHLPLARATFAKHLGRIDATRSHS